MKHFYQFLNKQAIAAYPRCVVYSMAFLLLCLLAMPSAGQAAQKKSKRAVIELSVTNLPLKDVLTELERQTEYTFVVNHSRLTSLNRAITVSIR